MFYIGCPMWGYKAWVGKGKLFPPRTPAGDFLRIYSRKLSAVEGNTTFYALPSREMVARWREETPPTFRICPKVSRDISHAPQLENSRDETLVFIERMRGLGERLGPIFLQLPPAFAPANLAQLETFLAFWPQDVRLAVEVRHSSFFNEPHAEKLNTLLHQYRAARVIMDTRPIQIGTTEEQQTYQQRERKPYLPVQISATTDFTFVRYIGHPELEANLPLLQDWAKQIGQWYTQGITSYVFCHCPFEEHAPAICAELYQLTRKVVPLPPLPPWEEEQKSTQPEQGRLF